MVRTTNYEIIDTLDNIERLEDWSSLKLIQFMFYFSPLLIKNKKKVCFDLIMFTTNDIYEKKEEEIILVKPKPKSNMDKQFGFCSNCGDYILSARGCQCWLEEAYTDSEPWEPDEYEQDWDDE